MTLAGQNSRERASGKAVYVYRNTEQARGAREEFVGNRNDRAAQRLARQLWFASQSRSDLDGELKGESHR